MKGTREGGRGGKGGQGRGGTQRERIRGLGLLNLKCLCENLVVMGLEFRRGEG